jgi:Ca2+-binding EF-hand superfamily protein
MFSKMFCRLAVLGAVAMLATIWAADSAFAQGKKSAKKPTLSKEEMLKKYDTNGDGKLDAKETKAMKDEQAKEAATKNPGASFPGAQNPEAGSPRTRPGGFGGADFEARRAEFEKRFDKNGDGKLDDEEKAAMEEARKQFAGKRGPGGIGGPEGEARRAEFMKKYDTNGNGTIDEDERAAIQKDMGSRGGPGGGGFGGPEGEARRAEFMKRFDTNGDGTIDDEERAAMQKQFGQGGPGGFRGKRPGGANPPNNN